MLGEACDERIAVGKLADGLELPFPVVDDGSHVRAPIAGVVGGLRSGTARALRRPAGRLSARHGGGPRSAGRAPAHAPTRPSRKPARSRCVPRTALPALQRRLAAERLSLRDALAELDTRTVELDEALLANVNTVDDLQRLLTGLAPAWHLPGRGQTPISEPVDAWTSAASCQDALALGAGADERDRDVQLLLDER